MRAKGVACGDLGDEFSAAGDRRPPHDDSLRVWHDLAQASATSPVTLGDKERPEDYLDFNDGHVLDLGEAWQGKGGVDRVVEWKALLQRRLRPPWTHRTAGPPIRSATPRSISDEPTLV